MVGVLCGEAAKTSGLGGSFCKFTLDGVCRIGSICAQD